MSEEKAKSALLEKSILVIWLRFRKKYLNHPSLLSTTVGLYLNMMAMLL